MTRRSAAIDHTGPLGPVAISGALLLLIASPLMRGGNRQIALLALESVALVVLLGVLIKPPRWTGFSLKGLLLVLLLLSPLWLALLYLVPVPAKFWMETPGRDIYFPLLRSAGIEPGSWLPLSLVPDATRASLLAGIPLVAAFLVGSQCRLSQLRLLLGVVVLIAFGEILLGLLQISGGPKSSLNFGMDADRPIGTFANANHLANYIGMALAAHVWLAGDGLLRPHSRSNRGFALFSGRHAVALWIAGGVLLVLGILITRSRGAAFTGLPVAMLCVALALSSSGRTQGWRATLALLGAVLAGAVVLVGAGSVLSRFDLSVLSASASYRSLLATTTMDGAWTFWPWGAGWGTYAAVYPRFQPLELHGLADYAHQDYAQMLFEGGIFAALLAVAFGALVVGRAAQLARDAWQTHELSRDAMAAALCGLGLLGFLLHSLVEFNMHIPANAILGALLAGAYLRPLAANGPRS